MKKITTVIFLVFSLNCWAQLGEAQAISDVVSAISNPDLVFSKEVGRDHARKIDTIEDANIKRMLRVELLGRMSNDIGKNSDGILEYVSELEKQRDILPSTRIRLKSVRLDVAKHRSQTDEIDQLTYDILRSSLEYLSANTADQRREALSSSEHSDHPRSLQEIENQTMKRMDYHVIKAIYDTVVFDIKLRHPDPENLAKNLANRGFLVEDLNYN